MNGNKKYCVIDYQHKNIIITNEPQRHDGIVLDDYKLGIYEDYIGIEGHIKQSLIIWDDITAEDEQFFVLLNAGKTPLKKKKYLFFGDEVAYFGIGSYSYFREEISKYKIDKSFAIIEEEI